MNQLEMRKFLKPLFFKRSDLGFRSKKVFLQFLVDILPFGFGSVDPHIFADPDPKHCNKKKNRNKKKIKHENIPKYCSLMLC